MPCVAVLFIIGADGWVVGGSILSSGWLLILVQVLENSMLRAILAILGENLPNSWGKYGESNGGVIHYGD